MSPLWRGSDSEPSACPSLLVFVCDRFGLPQLEVIACLYAIAAAGEQLVHGICRDQLHAADHHVIEETGNSVHQCGRDWPVQLGERRFFG